MNFYKEAPVSQIKLTVPPGKARIPYAFLFTCCFFAMSQIVVQGQPEKLRFEHLGVEQGLADNTAIGVKGLQLS